MKTLQLCLLLRNISASLRIPHNITVIISTKRYGTDTFLSFSSLKAFSTAKDFANLITK